MVKNKRKVVIKRKVHKAKSRKVYVPPKLPEKPSVDKGPNSYGKSKAGQEIVPRFFIAQWMPGIFYKDAPKNSPWYVVDLENSSRRYSAKGTSSSGYKNKSTAKKIAEEYRETYGAWTRMPF